MLPSPPPLISPLARLRVKLDWFCQTSFAKAPPAGALAILLLGLEFRQVFQFRLGSVVGPRGF
jgi:hypothetical protein